MAAFLGLMPSRKPSNYLTSSLNLLTFLLKLAVSVSPTSSYVFAKMLNPYSGRGLSVRPLDSVISRYLGLVMMDISKVLVQNMALSSLVNTCDEVGSLSLAQFN